MELKITSCYKDRMTLSNVLFSCLLLVVCVPFTVRSQSPVFLGTDSGTQDVTNKDSVVLTSADKSNSPDTVTQTVYGFLDFTTMIGNTVMVFSPQSSSIPTTSENHQSTPESTTVINEKPQSTVGATESIEITPNKTTPSTPKLAELSEVTQGQTTKIQNVYSEKPKPDESSKKQVPSGKSLTTKSISTIFTAENKKEGELKSAKTKEFSKGTTVELPTIVKPVADKLNKPVIISSRVEIAAESIATPSLSGNKSDKNKKNEKLKGGKLDSAGKSSLGPAVGKPDKSTTKGSTTPGTTKAAPGNNTKPKVVASKVEIRTSEATSSSVSGKDSSVKTEKSSTVSTKAPNKENTTGIQKKKTSNSSENAGKKSTSVRTTVHSSETKSTTPEKSATTAEKPATTPEKVVTTPEKSTTASEKSTIFPENDVATLDNIGTTVGKASTNPEKGETTPSINTEEPAVISSNGVLSPEYDYLSRQPSEVVDETFRVIDLRSNTPAKYQKSKTGHKTYGSHGSQNQYQSEEPQPVGLITSLVDSVVKDGLTTHYETDVIGTVISGKYAQVLQSTSHITPNPKKIKPTPSTGIRILKTAAPTVPRSNKSPNLEPTPVYDFEDDSSSQQVESIYNSQLAGGHIKSSKKATFGGNLKNRYSHKNKAKEDFREDYGTSATDDDETLDTDFTASGSNPTPPPTNPATPSYKKATTKGNKATTHSGRTSPKYQNNNRYGKPLSPELATVSVFSETVSSVTPSSGSSNGRRFTPSNRRATVKAVSNSLDSEKNSFTSKRSYKQKIGPSNVENNQINPSSSTYKFKLSRPSGRWQYKTSPKPRVTIRRQDDLIDNVTVNPIPQFTPDVQLDSSDQELSGSGIYPALQHEDNSIVQDIVPSVTAETIRVEISTPSDFRDVYYEIATIKSPYSFQVGTVKNTRFITVTSTFEKSLLQTSEPIIPSKTGEPLSENILATAANNAYAKEPPLDSSIATLPPIGLAGDAETPPLETTTETFSTTQLMLKTHILPVVRGGSDTSRYTLVQSYHVTRVVTATKTLPPMEVYQFVPSRTLNEFNTRLDEAGSELHLELDFGDNNEQDEENYPNAAKTLLSDLDLTNIGSDFDISDVDKNKLLEAHLRAKKAHKIRALTQSTTPLSTSENPVTPALSAEQLQQLALLRLLNPNAAVPNVVTSSKPIIKVETAYETHIIPIFNGASTYFTTISRPTATLTKTDFEYVTSTLPLLQPSVFNPLFPQQPPFPIPSTPLVTQTMVTETNSKVLKLTFGAKTTYTTLYSTKVSPTLLTTYLTNSLSVQPTAVTFPSFFNPQYVPFPFMG